jgi:coenzyme F420-reducing hydrogenase delta subunit
VEQAREILEKIGLGGGRVEMYNLSSGEGTLFVKFAIEMNERIRELGPNPIKLAKTGKGVETETGSRQAEGISS